LTVFQRKYLEKSLKQSLSKQYFKRIKIMLLADEGKTQTQICQELGCSHSTARHWITLAKSGQAHQWNSNAIGRPQTVNDRCLQRLRELVTQSPREVKVPNRDFTYHTRQWTAKKLSEHLWAELGIKISDRHINRLLKQIGLSTRPKSNNLEKNDPKKSETNQSSKSGIVIRDIPEDVAFS
jgi:transposase